MRITNSTAAERAEAAALTRKVKGRQVELVGLLAASLLTIVGLWLVSSARAISLQDAAQAMAAGRILDLNRVDRAEQLLPLLEGIVGDTGERRFVADRLAAWINTPDGSGSARRRILGVSAIGTITITESDLPAKQRMT